MLLKGAYCVGEHFVDPQCVYLYTGLSLACYLENIRVTYVVDENILPNSVCLAIK